MLAEEAQALADAEQPLLRPHLGLGVVPLRTAHRPEQHGVAFLRGGQRLVGQGHAGLVDGDAAHQGFTPLEGVAEHLADLLQDARGLASDFGADAVPGKNADGGFHLATRLEGGDRLFLFQQEAQLVDSVQQAVAGERLDGKRLARAVRTGDLLRFEIDGDGRARRGQ